MKQRFPSFFVLVDEGPKPLAIGNALYTFSLFVRHPSRKEGRRNFLGTEELLPQFG